MHQPFFATLNHELLEAVRCPQCRGGGLEVTGDPPRELTCPACASTVPIIDGIPRLAGQTESYATSFGRQWNRYDVVRPEEDEATFLVKTGVSSARSDGSARARRRLRRRPLCPAAGFPWRPGHCRRSQLGRRQG